MNQSFKVDESVQRTALFAGKQLLPAATIVALSVAFGSSAKVSVGVALVGITLAAFTVFARRIGANQVTLDSESLVIEKSKGQHVLVPIQRISAVRIKKDVLVVAWREDDRPKSVIFGRESFTEATWQQLSAAISALADGITSVSSKASA